jgi:hypothetical protein
MAIENRNLPVGTRLVANYKKTRYVCTVVAGEEEGQTAFALEDGKTFKSPSAAGSAVMGGTACNGWRFWSVEGDEPAPAEKKAPKAAKPARGSPAKPKAAAQPKRATKKATKLLYPMPDQSGASEDMTKWWCNACMASFEVYGTEKAEQCPEGHRIDDPELTAPAGVSAAAEASDA